jgi:hypothetical protein
VRELLAWNGGFRNNFQVLSVKAQLLTALWTIAPVSLNDLARGLQLKPSVEELATLGA